MAKLSIVGIGPGDKASMTHAAYEALSAAEVICGYSAYIKLIKQFFPDKPVYTSGMGAEEKRCRWALSEARVRDVALISSGDAGVYGLAGLVLELLENETRVDVELIPGVTAALSGAALLGAPLTNDFCTISLSDYLTPWERIAHRLRCVSEAGIAICLYNPASKQRPHHLKMACDILLESRGPNCACGWVRNIGRAGQEKRVLSLAELREASLDMFTTVFIGAPETYIQDGLLITPRGYEVRQ